MFRITIMVQDKHLPETLRRLVGYVVGSPEVEPVVNAEVRGGKIKAHTNGTNTDVLIDYMRSHNMQEFSGPQARSACEELGLNKSSYSHYIQTGIKQKRLKRIGSGKGNAVRYQIALVREDKA